MYPTNLAEALVGALDIARRPTPRWPRGAAIGEGGPGRTERRFSPSVHGFWAVVGPLTPGASAQPYAPR